MDFYAVFIDLTTAFDTVNREAIWTTLYQIHSSISRWHERHHSLERWRLKATWNFLRYETRLRACSSPLQPVLRVRPEPCSMRPWERGVPKYRLDDPLFDLRGLNVKTKTRERFHSWWLCPHGTLIVWSPVHHYQIWIAKYNTYYSHKNIDSPRKC